MNILFSFRNQTQNIDQSNVKHFTFLWCEYPIMANCRYPYRVFIVFVFIFVLSLSLSKTQVRYMQITKNSYTTGEKKWIFNKTVSKKNI